MPRKKTKVVEQDGCLVKVVHLKRVQRARKKSLAPERLERMSGLYKALGDPTRLTMLLALMDGEMCVCDLAALTGTSDSAMSHQLRRLKDLALVKNRREGQILYYSLDDHHVAQLLETTVKHLDH
jgi:ArsR family transcriptional regulator, lead/cadmium/zinc/bismuth-responsive transcriptional repressor